MIRVAVVGIACRVSACSRKLGGSLEKHTGTGGRCLDSNNTRGGGRDRKQYHRLHMKEKKQKTKKEVVPGTFNACFVWSETNLDFFRTVSTVSVSKQAKVTVVFPFRSSVKLKDRPALSNAPINRFGIFPFSTLGKYV